MGSSSVCRYVPPKFLQTLQLVMPLTIDEFNPGLHMQSSKNFFMESRCQCLLDLCFYLARFVASSLVTHLTLEFALVLWPPATRDSLPSSIMYSDARWRACFFCHRLAPWSISSSVSMTFANIGLSLKRSFRLAISGVLVLER